MHSFFKIIATGFGTGFAPKAPGTAGAFLASCIIGICLYFQIDELILSYYIIPALTLVFLFLGAEASKRMEDVWGHDASKIVVDEMVGIWVSLLLVPITWQNILLSFVLFRVFDIWKPLGIRKFENFKNGWGVMMDDVAAGIYANIVLQIIIWLS